MRQVKISHWATGYNMSYIMHFNPVIPAKADQGSAFWKVHFWQKQR